MRRYELRWEEADDRTELYRLAQEGWRIAAVYPPDPIREPARYVVVMEREVTDEDENPKAGRGARRRGAGARRVRGAPAAKPDDAG